MQPNSAKSLLALAVTAVITSPALAYDGYDYSGQTARSQALQLDYFSHQDVGDIWVNPALVRHYQGQVMVNINNENNDGQGSGGLLLGSGDHTFGVYIGRDSVSSYGSSLNLLDYDNETGAALSNLQPVIDERNPENQFDLFYGFSGGDFAFGVRLNYQDNQQDARSDSGTFAVLNTMGAPTFATMDQALAHYTANIEAQFANDPDAPTPADLIFNGSAEAGNFNDGYTEAKAREFNLSLGFEIQSLRLDGALLYGQASGSYTVSQAATIEDFTLENDGDDNQVVRRISQENIALRDRLEIDDGSTLGLSLRMRMMESQTSRLLASFAYVTQDYTANFSGTGRASEVLWTDDEDNLQAGTAEERYTTSGKMLSESELIRLMAAYELRPNNRAAITLVSGFEQRDLTTGFSYAISEDIETVSADIDGTFGLDEGQFTTTFGEVGPQSRRDISAEINRIPLVIALEYGLNERWTGRTSIARDLYRETKMTEINYSFDGVENADTIDPPEPDDANQSAQSGSDRRIETNRVRMGDSESWVRQPTSVQLGVGYQRDGLSIDTLVGKEFFTRGTDNTLFAAVSVGYKF